MGFKVTGLDSLQKQFDGMIRKANALDGEHKVEFSKLFPEEFMRKHTDYSSINDFFDATGLKVDSQQDFDDLPEDELDVKVQQLTKYKTWKDFAGEAAADYFTKKLGLS